MDEGQWGAGALPAWGQGQGHSPAWCSVLSSWGPRLSLGQGAPDAMAGRTLGAQRAHADGADAADVSGRIADGARRQRGGCASSSQPGSCTRSLQSVTETPPCPGRAVPSLRGSAVGQASDSVSPTRPQQPQPGPLPAPASPQLPPPAPTSPRQPQQAPAAPTSHPQPRMSLHLDPFFVLTCPDLFLPLHPLPSQMRVLPPPCNTPPPGLRQRVGTVAGDRG